MLTPATAHAGPAIPALAAFAASPIGSMILNMLISTVVSNIFGGGKQKGMQANARERAVMVNKNSSNEPLPVVYGRRRTGGTRVYVETGDASSGDADKTGGTKHLAIVLAMCEGEMGSLKRVYFNDEIIFDGTLAHGGRIDSGNQVAGNRYAGTYEIDYFAGTESQTHSTLISDVVGTDNWTTNYDLGGVAYLALKLTADAEKYSGGVPLITAEMAGKRIDEITSGGSSNVASADQNPVDVLHDYLTNSRYGKGLGTAEIDTASFRAARDHIQNNTTTDGNSMRINGALQTDVPLFENINQILDTANLMLIYSGGVYKLIQRKQSVSAESHNQFNKDDFIGAMQVTMPNKKNFKNKMTVNFPDADTEYNYNENMVVVPVSTDTARVAYLAQDNNQPLEGKLDFNLVTSKALVQELAEYKLDFSRKAVSVFFELPHTRLNTECGDVISITNSDFGFTNKLFTVMQIELTTDNTIKIVATEYNSSVEII